jgi:amino acid adenylation domain-containing protein/non-ribosomal peptide synthase protein (TIGR01720 family)
MMNKIVQESYPLSYGQQAIWFIYEMAPESLAYNIFITVKINSYLNVPVFMSVWEQIFKNNSILRTTYTVDDGKPVQHVHEQQKSDIEIIDASNWSEDNLKEKIFAETDRPFNLEKDSVLRVNLFTRSGKEHVLLLAMHHIAGDMWSFDLLLSEFMALYNNEIEQASQEQTETAKDSSTKHKSYIEFVRWQSEMLSSSRGEKLWQYWQKQLAGDLPILNLLADKLRPPVQSYKGETHVLKLDEQLVQKVNNLALAFGTSAYKLLLAALYILIYRYTDQKDILIGSPMRGRGGKDFQNIVGYFVNRLVLRTSIDEGATFNEFLTQVSNTVKEAQKHQHYPFSLLVEQLQQQRDASRSPLCQVGFVWQAQRWCKPTENSLHQEQVLQIEPYLLGHQRGANLDLNLMVMEAEGVLQLCWQYNTDLFEATTIARMASHFLTLLEGIVTNPTQLISQLPLLTEIEQQQLLVEWNNQKADYPFDKCIHQLFEEQVERTPDAIAVVFKHQQLTYHQLNTRANQLAHYLRSLGVGADVLVGLCVERSLEMIVGVLGILKAGGAYLPLDPEYPTERLGFMLNDAQVPVLLTQHLLVAELPTHNAELVCLDTDWPLISQAMVSNLFSGVQPENLAYAIYTSGSTGEPKGVMIQHSSVLNLANGLHQAIYSQHQNPQLRVSLNGSLAFDTSVKQIVQLIYGYSLEIIPENLRFDGSAMLSYLRQQKINVLDCTPSQLALLISAGLLESNTTLQYVLVGGEPIDESMWATLAQAKNINFYNVYGPTECTVDATVCKIQAANLKPIIGRPIANVQTYILDKYLQLVPVGIPGELHIGGASLARSYLNAKELTQEKFIPNPFNISRADESFNSQRLYKTGDLARYLPDGNIEYLGRIDNQVKIRGFRIELGEIETVLNDYPNIQASCVIAREDNPGIKRLVAYIVPQKQVASTTRELRQFLKAKLPGYMIPSAFVILEALPLTRNGKVDRRALPAPDGRVELEVSFVAPHTPEEKVLAQIWSQVLKVEEVGIHDNFFELGGDSILNIQIITRARQAGLQLTPKQLFTHQTIAELAVVAGTTKIRQIEQGLVTGQVPLTPIQHWFFEQNLSQKHHYNQSFLLSVPSDLKSELLEQVWQQLLIHHDALRLQFTQSDCSWQQIHSTSSDNIPVSFVDLSTIPDSEQQEVIEATTNSLQASLNLTENLVQVAFFWLGVDKRAHLLIIIHQLVVDDVSWRILLEDLQTAYQQLCQGQAIQLPAKTTSFKNWAQHLVEYAQSDVLKSELSYWLSASKASSPIPVDFTGGANTVASASTVSVCLNEVQTQALLQDVPKAYKTQINDVLLTALVLVLSRWTRSSSVLLNLEGHGRENIVDGVDLSRTVGWFTAIFPVVLKVEAIDKDNIGNTLKSVKEQLRAIPNKGIGYGLLRYLSREPEIIAQLKTLEQAEISFNYLGEFTQLNQSSIMQLTSESRGQVQSSQSSHNRRLHLLDINAIITNERLQIDWTYSINVHQPRTIETLAQEFIETLGELIAHCSSSENGVYTPTDFPLLQLNQLELDQIFANL